MIPKTLLFLLLLGGFTSATAQKKSTLHGKIICLDAGHGGTALTDSYRVGPTGEREEWVNLRVALLLQKLLEKKGATVLMTRTTEENVPFDQRVQLAKQNKADVFLSIHHNATADTTANFPIVYYHGYASENAASVLLAQKIVKSLIQNTYPAKTPFTIASDHVIFPTAGAKVLRDTYGIPAVIAEASFFTNPTNEAKLKQPAYNQQEAAAYVAALEAFFAQPTPDIKPKNSLYNLPPFRAFQEAERMGEVAKNWGRDFEQGVLSADLSKALELFTRSVRSFPDSPVAAKCHEYRAQALGSLGNQEEAKQEAIRAKEFYVTKLE
ncbi:MAG: N-acetylmuramoyl-L-alanine amidase family protein [Rufibacter sp.]